QVQSQASLNSRSSGTSESQRTSAGVIQWQCSFHSDTLNAELRFDNTSEELQFREVAAPRRTLTYRSGYDGPLRLEIETPEGDSFLMRQSDNGEFFVVLVSDNKVREEHDKSFVDFAREHRRFVETEVLPLLGRFGIVPLASANSPEVRSAVLSKLLQVSASR